MTKIGFPLFRVGRLDLGRWGKIEPSDYSADSLHPFIASNLALDATAKTDGMVRLYRRS